MQEDGIKNYKDIFKNNINRNETKEKIYKQIQDLILNTEYSSYLESYRKIIDTYIDLNINNSRPHIELLNDRIDKIKLNNDFIKKYETTINSIIDQFINYITEVQIAYFITFRDSENDNNMTINTLDLHNIFREENTTKIDNIENFIKEYRKIIKKNFDLINDKLSNHETEEYDYHKQNNVTNYLLNNYNLSNNNHIKTYIKK